MRRATEFGCCKEKRSDSRCGIASLRGAQGSARQDTFQRAYCGLGRFAATAHLAKTNVAVVRLHFHNGPNEASPVAAVSLAECCVQGNGHCIGANICDLHKAMPNASLLSRSMESPAPGGSSFSRCPSRSLSDEARSRECITGAV